MSRRVERCEHLMLEKRCTMRNCRFYDGGARHFRIGKDELARCKRCKRRVPKEELEANDGFCASECDTSTLRVGYGRRRPDPVKAFDRRPEDEKESA